MWTRPATGPPADLATPGFLRRAGARRGLVPRRAYAAQLLADWGADVVKAEPLEGDAQPPHRRAGRAVDVGDLRRANRGKRSIALDLRSEEGARRWPASRPAPRRRDPQPRAGGGRGSASTGDRAGGQPRRRRLLDLRVRRRRPPPGGRARPDHPGRLRHLEPHRRRPTASRCAAPRRSSTWAARLAAAAAILAALYRSAHDRPRRERVRRAVRRRPDLPVGALRRSLAQRRAAAAARERKLRAARRPVRRRRRVRGARRLGRRALAGAVLAARPRELAGTRATRPTQRATRTTRALRPRLAAAIAPRPAAGLRAGSTRPGSPTTSRATTTAERRRARLATARSTARTGWATRLLMAAGPARDEGGRMVARARRRASASTPPSCFVSSPATARALAPCVNCVN